jgi:TonB family protein
MDTRSILVGVFEQKRPYQKNLALGFGISGTVFLAAISSILLIISLNPAPPIPIFTSPNPIPINTTFAPTTPLPKPIDSSGPKAKPLFGIPTPVADTEAVDNIEMPTQNQLTGFAPDLPITNLDGNIQLDTSKIFKEMLPDPTAFVRCDQMPVEVSMVQPKYPDLARRSGIVGAVWVKALIDKEGHVRDAIIVKSSGAEAGFEEAALEAARQSIWKPAISNGIPIAIWVTYKVEFMIE